MENNLNNEAENINNNDTDTSSETGVNRIESVLIEQLVRKIADATSHVIIGQHEVQELLLTALFANGHILLEGVPGVAKTLMSKVLARLIDVDYNRIQFTPDLMPSDVIGTNVFHPQESKFVFRKGPIFSNIVLIDEINRAPAKTQSALFEVMEERQITVDGVTNKLAPPFMVIATQNPIEHEGTYRLPEAQLDRFLFKINIHYPNLEEEVKMLHLHHSRQEYLDIQKIQPVVTKEELLKARTVIAQVHVEEKLMDFIARIVNATRNNRYLYLGASPRASIALLQASKSLAVLRGRDFVTPDDILYIAPAVLRHRISLTPEREMDGATTDDIIKEVLAEIEVPR